MKFLFSLCSLALLSTNAFSAELIKLKNGDTIRGDVLEQRFNESVKVRVESGGEITVPWSDVDSIVKEAPPEAPAETTPAVTAAEPAPSPAPIAAAPSDVDTLPEAAPPRDPRFWMYLSLGATVSNSTNYQADRAVSATSVLSRDDNGATSPLIGFEFLGRLTPMFGLSALVEVSRYNFENSSAAGDTEVSLFLMPRVQTTGDHGHLWAGFAFGYVHTQVGQVRTISLTSTSTVDSFMPAFGISPRVGADFNLSPKVTLGFEASYVTATGKLGGSYTSNPYGSTINYTQTLKRSWIGLAARGGFGF